MTRVELLKHKDAAVRRLLTYHPHLDGVKPIRWELCEEVTAAAAFVIALNAELGEPLVPPEVGTVHGCVRQAIFLLNRFLTENPDPTGNLVRVIDQLSAALPKGGAS